MSDHQYKFNVTMTCGGCVRRVTAAVQSVDSDPTVTANVGEHRVDIQSTSTQQALIAALENANLIPNATYYREILKPGCDKNFMRSIWHRKSLETLSESNIIFCDPDNGLIVKSVSQKSIKSDKYIIPDELISYYQAGKSLIFYNHRCREQEQVYLQRFQMLKQRNELVGAEWRGLKFVRGTIRDYIFILQPQHLAVVDKAIKNMMKTNWNKHFSELNI